MARFVTTLRPMKELSLLLSPEQPLTRLAVALAIGLLIGLERGWSARDEREGERAAGLRTHAISGLLGGIAALIGLSTTMLFLGFAFLGFAGVSVAFHMLEARNEKNFSATGAIAGLMAFLLGALSVLGEPGLAAAAATATVILLALKSTLHRFIRGLDWIEIRAVLILIAMSFIFLPLLPDHTLDPWDTLNPAQIWEFAIFICALSFAGYVSIKIFGEEKGVLIAACAGGLVSSTAATLNFSKLAKRSASDSTVMTGAIALSSAVMCLRILVIAGLLNWSLGVHLLPIMISVATVQSVIGIVLIMTGSRKSTQTFEWKNPFELSMAFRFALFIALIFLASTIAARHVGPEAVWGVAAFAGLADVDAITLSLARMETLDPLIHGAVEGILIAALTNTIMKTVLAGLIGGRLTGLRVAGVNCAALLTGLAAFTLLNV